jgi:hypothetical protein
VVWKVKRPFQAFNKAAFNKARSQLISFMFYSLNPDGGGQRCRKVWIRCVKMLSLMSWWDLISLMGFLSGWDKGRIPGPRKA